MHESHAKKAALTSTFVLLSAAGVSFHYLFVALVVWSAIFAQVYVNYRIVGTLVVLGLTLGFCTFSLTHQAMHATRFVLPWTLAFEMASISVAHSAEYFFVCICHPKELSWSSFLLNQSKEYVLAFSISTLEFCLEFWLKP